MTYIRLEDGFFRNPKARRLGKDGRALYLAGLCHCSAQMTDGHIDKHVLPIVLLEADVKPTAVTVLVENGAWTDEGDHYRIHDYLSHQRSKEQVERERERWRRNKRGDK